MVGLEIQKIAEEIDAKIRLIEYLEGIISDPQKLDEVLAQEFEYMKEKYGDERRTELSNDLSVYNISGSLKELQKAADKVLGLSWSAMLTRLSEIIANKPIKYLLKESKHQAGQLLLFFHT